MSEIERLDKYSPKTLRDEFAMAALQGELAAQGEVVGIWLSPFESLTKHCYAVADAMLAEREKGKK